MQNSFKVLQPHYEILQLLRGIVLLFYIILVQSQQKDKHT